MTDFAALHQPGAPLRLVNAWDALSARVLALSGAPAIGTSSFGVALARGYADGQLLPWPEMVDAVAVIVRAVGDVPVTADIEAGWGSGPAEVRAAVNDVAEAGVAGINLEDKVPDGTDLFPIDEQCARLTAARAVDESLFINARCDAFFGAGLDVAAAIERGQRYADAGASGFFVPGLADIDAIRRIVDAVPLPVNVMLWPGLPSIAQLADAGVARISQGGSLFLAATGFLQQATTGFLTGEPADFAGAVTPAYNLLPGLVYR